MACGNQMTGGDSMKMTVQQASDVLTAYIVDRLVPQASLVGKAKLGFILPVLPTLMSAQVPAGAAIGVVDCDGNLDLDTFERCTRSAMETAGKIVMAGFTFTAADVDAFFAFAADRVKGSEPAQ